MQDIVTWGQNMSANIEEFACISMGGLFTGVPPGWEPRKSTRVLLYPGYMTVYRYQTRFFHRSGFVFEGPVYRHISGVYNTRVFFGVIIHEIHRAVQEFYDSLYALTHAWASMAFRSHFSISGHIRSIVLFTMYYFPAINISLSLHYTEILNSIINPSTPYRTRQARSLSRRAKAGVSHPILRKDKFTTNINLWQFSVLNTVDLLIQHSPD